MVCKDYKQVLQERLDNIYWNEIENLVGYNNSNKMKQGSAFTGEIYLGNNRIDTKACELLAPALAKMTVLEELGLNGNRIDAKACEVLAPVLVKMSALKQLYLWDNRIDAKAC